MDIVTQRMAPTSAISVSKYGKTMASTTVLTNNSVLMKMKMNLLFQFFGKLFSMPFAIGVIMSAYLTIGIVKVVYIAIFEMTLLVGRLIVT